MSRRGLLSLAGSIPLWGLGGPPSGVQTSGALDVRNFGAKGDGITDDRAAIQGAIDAAGAAGGGTVHVPPGTYLLRSVQGRWRILLRPRTGVSLVGAGAASILRAASGLNRPVADEGYSFIRHVEADEGRPRCDDFSVSGLTFDHNGTENLIARGIRSNGNMALGIAVGRRIRFENNICRNNPGAQTVTFGANRDPASVEEVFVRGNLFEGMGGGVPGNANNADHSTIYLQVDGGLVAHNIFRNSGAPRLNTAIETHGSGVIVTQNVVEGYSICTNIAATVCSARNILISDNVGSRLNHGAVLWQYDPFELGEVNLRGNLLECVADPTGPAPAFIDADSHVAAGVGRVEISGNLLRSREQTESSRALAGIRLGRGGDLLAIQNRIDGFSGRGIELGNVTPEARLVVDSNDITDCASTAVARYRQALAFNTLVQLGVLHVTRNRVRWTGPGSGRTGISGNAMVRRGEVSGNHVVGADAEVMWSGDAPPLIDHSGAGAPGAALHAAPGSRWRQLSAGSGGKEYIFGPGGWLAGSTGP